MPCPTRHHLTHRQNHLEERQIRLSLGCGHLKNLLFPSQFVVTPLIYAFSLEMLTFLTIARLGTVLGSLASLFDGFAQGVVSQKLCCESSRLFVITRWVLVFRD
ncbi:hypothetical protein CDAR_316261 [Caerostris darwini]|uniref:Solute carrier family 40 protein n=1 Tax=Caerostris darwini TaxID=1538125 RepID=A0AAV4QC12_9ARAC|nr:hypothetical protein CDAR_316261 [Caerostris darwini]